MPVTDFSTFDEQLFRYIAGLNSGALTIEDSPRSFFLHEWNDNEAGDTFSILRRFGGAQTIVPAPTLDYQVETLGASAAAMTRAELIRMLFCDANKKPKRNILLTDFRIIGVTSLSMPGLIARDEKDRARVIFNFSVLVNAR